MLLILLLLPELNLNTPAVRHHCCSPFRGYPRLTAVNAVDRA